MKINSEDLKAILDDVKSGELSTEDAVERLRSLPFEDLGFARIDHHRQIRRGFAEVIYCPGKTTEQIVQIFSSLAKRGNNVLATRAGREVYDALLATGGFEGLCFEEQARAVVLEQKNIKPLKSVLPIVTAGTADLPVAAEAMVTARVMGQPAEIICDVGVAGLHRLLEHVPKLRKANVVIVIAGMEGALASVTAGLIDSVVIAVPTSVGTGASFEGLSALLTMLNSCASGVTVVNIDNGFSAAMAAVLINRKIEPGR